MEKSENNSMTFMDRFWYKLVIGLVLLVCICLLDKFGVIKLSDVKAKLTYNINSLEVIQKVNGKVNIIDLGNESEIAVSTEPIEYVNGNCIKTNSLEGVRNYACGVCVKILKDNDKYEVTILGLDNKKYIYGNLETLDIHIYSYVKTKDVIGSSSSFYTLEMEENGKM
ncbi:MAG: hypothetical protein MRZ09_00665 [Coprobacillus sp.]|nr:hypothetical protein [Coprobacillus sp.]MDY4144964.1 hypothetical protein [Bacilli bacterium]